MGLYIPDLKLPADGDFELWIAVKKDGSFTYNVRGGWQDGKQKAIPVPPHGRLIDADKIKESIKSQLNVLMHFGDDDLQLIAEVLKVGFFQEIDNAPTIIEAEEGET